LLLRRVCLIRPVRLAADQAGPRWLLTYRPHLYAGLQVLLQCMVNGGTLVVPEPDASPAATVELMIGLGADASEEQAKIITDYLSHTFPSKK